MNEIDLDDFEKKLLNKAAKDKIERVCVGALIETKSGILIVKRKENETFWPGLWEIPAGDIKIGEKLRDALEREVREETGQKIIEIEKYLGHCQYKVESKEERCLIWKIRIKDAQIQLTEHDEYLYIKEIEQLKGKKFGEGMENFLIKYFRQREN